MPRTAETNSFRHHFLTLQFFLKILSGQTVELVVLFSSPTLSCKQNKATEMRFLELQRSSGSRWPVICITTQAGSHKYTLCTDIVGANILAVWMYGLGSQMLCMHPEHCAYVPSVEAR